MTIKNLPITTLKPYHRNPRHNDTTVEQLVLSIPEFGFVQPIVVDIDNTIIIGHARYRAAQRLKLKKVPVVVAENLTAEQVKKLRIADNKIGEASQWDDTALLQELREIGNSEEMQAYFADTSLEKLLKESVGHEVKPITGDQMKNTQGRMDGAHDQDGNASNMIECICPHCGEEFKLDKTNIS
jgi:ParB-like chromosome segregation protein Spo0J